MMVPAIRAIRAISGRDFGWLCRALLPNPYENTAPPKDTFVFELAIDRLDRDDARIRELSGGAVRGPAHRQRH